MQQTMIMTVYCILYTMDCMENNAEKSSKSVLKVVRIESGVKKIINSKNVALLLHRQQSSSRWECKSFENGKLNDKIKWKKINAPVTKFFGDFFSFHSDFVRDIQPSLLNQFFVPRFEIQNAHISATLLHFVNTRTFREFHQKW